MNIPNAPFIESIVNGRTHFRAVEGNCWLSKILTPNADVFRDRCYTKHQNTLKVPYEKKFVILTVRIFGLPSYQCGMKG